MQSAFRLIGLTGMAIFLGACSAVPTMHLGDFEPDPIDSPLFDPWVNNAGWTLNWSDEFNNASVDTSKWKFETGNNNGWGNSELEYYQAANASIQTIDELSCLVITAKKEAVNGFQYSSARLKTQGLKSWTYGRFEARMKLPYGQGIWPAFWMLGDTIGDPAIGWPRCGEIDIMEMVGGGSKDYTHHGTIHWWNDSLTTPAWQYVGFANALSDKLCSAFHVYGVEWSASSLIWYIDGKPFYTESLTASDRSEFVGKPFFILLNLAVGGQWPGVPDAITVFPQTMAIDWVRIYQK